MKMNTLILLLVIFASASFAQESSYLPNPYLEVPSLQNQSINGKQNVTIQLLPGGGNGGGTGGISDSEIASELFTYQERTKLKMLSVDTFMGDSIDKNSGALSFYHTDVEIPGNYSLPVKISRRLPAGDSPLIPFRNWGLDVPYVSGRFGFNWRYYNDRCSQLMPVESGEYVPIIYFYAGLTLNDGNGYSDKILELDSNAPVSPPSGYQYMTKSGWAVKCITAKDGNEGFQAKSPNGTVYTFDVVVWREYPPAKRNGRIRRTRMYGLMASKVTDRFGNTVLYNYEASVGKDVPDRLGSITSSDGRRITLSYEQGTNWLASVSANDREWLYSPAQDNDSELKTVTLPDKTEWSFDLHDLAMRTPRPGQAKNILDVSLTHPQGARATYHIEDLVRFKPFMPVEIPVTSSPSEVQQVETLAVHSRVINVSGVDYRWDYSYSDSSDNVWDMDANGDPLPTHSTTVTGPNSIRVFTYFRYFNWFDGLLSSVEIKDLTGSLLERKEYKWYPR